MRLIASFLISVCAVAQVSPGSKTLFPVSDTILSGWSTWGSNNVILFSKWVVGSPSRFELYSINPDGTGESCVTCSMPGLPPNVSRGSGHFRVGGSWMVFQAQDAGSNPAIFPGNGEGYDMWVTDWPRVNGPWLISGSNSATYWPRWSPTGNRLAYSKAYESPSEDYPYGKSALHVWDFTPGNPPVLFNFLEFEFPTGSGLAEMGDWVDDDTVLSLAAPYPGQIGEYQYAMDIVRLYLPTGYYTPITDHWLSDNAWDEFPFKVPGHNFYMWLRKTPPLVLAGPSDVWVMSPGGHPKRQLTRCNEPGDPMYYALSPVGCLPRGFSPDGKTMLVDRSYAGGLRRDMWMVGFNVYAGDPATIHSGKIVQAGKVVSR